MKYLFLVLLLSGCTTGAINLNVDKSVKTDVKTNDVKTTFTSTNNAKTNAPNNSVNTTTVTNNNQKTNNITSTANVNVSNSLLKK